MLVRWQGAHAANVPLRDVVAANVPLRDVAAANAPAALAGAGLFAGGSRRPPCTPCGGQGRILCRGAPLSRLGRRCLWCAGGGGGLTLWRNASPFSRLFWREKDLSCATTGHTGEDAPGPLTAPPGRLFRRTAPLSRLDRETCRRFDRAHRARTPRSACRS